jgi:undecaprenyl-diphosphatase
MGLTQPIAWALRRIVREEARLLLVGLVVVLAIWVFVEIADEVGEGGLPLDEATLRRLRQPGDPTRLVGPPWLVEVARDVTALGSPALVLTVLLAVLGYLVLEGQWGKLALVATAATTGAALSTALKVYFDRARPGLWPPLVPATSPSFPSGHAMLTAVVYLTLGALLARFVPRRRSKAFVLAVAMLLSFLVGLSRVYLGVHYPTDVLGGWAAGLAWALACWLVARYLQRRGALRAKAGPAETAPQPRSPARTSG